MPSAAPARPILVVEDEPFIAMDLQMAFEDAGCDAAVASSCADALALLDSIDVRGAVLDVNLGRGETCWPIAERLSQRGIPFLLHTGDLNREGERLRTTNAPIIAKPTLAEEVVERLLAMLKSKTRS